MLKSTDNKAGYSKHYHWSFEPDTAKKT